MDSEQRLHNDSPDLLGYRLGLLEAAERDRVEASVDEAQRIELCRGLDRLLAPLNGDVAECPGGLEDRILAAVAGAAATGRTIPFPAGGALPSAQDVRTRGGALTTVRELAGLAAVILLFVGVAVPGYRHARSQAKRAACADNMRMVGPGIASYVEAAGPLKLQQGPADGTWVRVENGQRVVQNTRIPFRLVRDGFVPGSAFICPAREGDLPLSERDLSAFHDFPDFRNNSFSTNFPWGGDAFAGDKPLMADLNPLVDEQRQLRRVSPLKLNSPSHGFSGQNVLGADFSVQFLTTPRLDGGADDIYRIEGIPDDHYTGTEKPERSDTFLIP